MNRGWADAEVALHVGLGGRSSEHARIGVDEGQILALLIGEALPTVAADAGSSDEEIARAVAVGGSTVYRTKRRFVEGNLERALSEDLRPGAERKLTGKEEALLVATTSGEAPTLLRQYHPEAASSNGE